MSGYCSSLCTISASFWYHALFRRPIYHVSLTGYWLLQHRIFYHSKGCNMAHFRCDQYYWLFEAQKYLSVFLLRKSRKDTIRTILLLRIPRNFKQFSLEELKLVATVNNHNLLRLLMRYHSSSIIDLLLTIFDRVLITKKVLSKLINTNVSLFVSIGARKTKNLVHIAEDFLHWTLIRIGCNVAIVVKSPIDNKI